MAIQETQKLTLDEAVIHLLEECRMVLPGIQALFGFQLIAVFNSTFAEKLSEAEQILHYTAIGLTGIAIAFVMAPAALHRQRNPREITQDFITLASRLLLCSMFPLMSAICVEFYLIGRIILHRAGLSLIFTGVLLAVLLMLWVVIPRLQKLQRLLAGRK